MTTQPEALHLSLLLAEVAPYLEGGERGQWIMSAAAELRRLHESNQELLEALKDLLHEADGCINFLTYSKTQEAIAKAERTTT